MAFVKWDAAVPRGFSLAEVRADHGVVLEPGTLKGSCRSVLPKFHNSSRDLVWKAACSYPDWTEPGIVGIVGIVGFVRTASPLAWSPMASDSADAVELWIDADVI